MSSVPGSGRSPGGGHSNPLQYSCLESHGQRSLVGLIFNIGPNALDLHGCCCSVAKWCLTLCDPMDSSTPGFLVPHQFLELAQTHVHWVGDDIQPSHPLLPSSPSAFKLSQHPGFFPKNQLLASGGQSTGDLIANICQLPGTVPSALHVHILLLLTMYLWGK